MQRRIAGFSCTMSYLIPKTIREKLVHLWREFYRGVIHLK